MSWFSLLGWLIGSKAGRIASVIVLTLVLLALDHIRKRIAIDEEIAGLPAAERRSRLMRWAQDR